MKIPTARTRIYVHLAILVGIPVLLVLLDPFAESISYLPGLILFYVYLISMAVYPIGALILLVIRRRKDFGLSLIAHVLISCGQLLIALHGIT